MAENLDKRFYDNFRTFGFDVSAIRLSEILFCFSVLSVFIPYKVYPLVFLVSALAFYFDTSKLSFPKWSVFLSVFAGYALISFIVTIEEQNSQMTNIIKLLVNFVYLYFAVIWLGQRDNNRLIKSLDIILHLIFILVFLQLLLYHQALDFRLVNGSSSSGQASMLYHKGLYFWGLEDKNMFGARIAMIGFPYILIPLIQKNKVSIIRIVIVFGLGYLSLSRTPIVALLIGCGYLLWISSNKWMRIGMVVFAIAALPFVLEKVIRVDQLTASNDGMGIRLVYWKSFFQHFREIPVLGVGFEKAPGFLKEYSDFYRGEPHIHNTFLTAYLEMGIIGLISYGLFLYYFMQTCVRNVANTHFWIMVFLPLLAIMMILYSGYDNDIVLYLSLIFLLGSHHTINFKETKLSLI